MTEDTKKLADLKNTYAYKQPPQHLIAATAGYVPGDAAWDDVQRWLDQNTVNGVVAMLVFMAERYDVSIEEAYSANAERRLPKAPPPVDRELTLDEYKTRSGYRDPPEDLADATTGKYLGEDAEWSVLHQWFRENTASPDEAMHCFIAQKYDTTVGEVYVAADGYFKRSGVGDNEYVNYN